MPQGFGLRAFWAILVAAAAAATVWAIGGDAQAALVALVGGVAAALLAATGEEPPTPAPLAPAAPADPPLGPLLDAVVEPLLLVEGAAVTIANLAARALLGDHIVGDDVRVAIRHPAAAERLARADTGSEGPVELVGLGPVDQRWEMRVAALGEGRRLVQLIDQTGSYAAERMRVDFVANASHELRTPLSSILGFIETLEEAGDDPATRARFLHIMGGEANRMQRLVEDLISLSRIEAEKYRPPSEPVDLAVLVEEVRAELAAAGDGRGRDLVSDVTPGLPPVGGDRAQLSQMLHNLGGNAMKYGRPGTPVTVALAAGGGPGMVRLSVSDRGEGIAPEHIPRLTERFYRIDAGRSRSLGGTGLGLAIVKHIVERHRGRLDITSRPGVGTTVAVTLPALSQTGNAPVTQARA
ncbi:ATP-binding protein [uncultured Sphingomonas sp.]|uniref:ATP-binding protein n=1 Tax=uncultured Sphingomonas sp. TaxID=158754 RepID=UPI0035CBBE30